MIDVSLNEMNRPRKSVWMALLYMMTAKAKEERKGRREKLLRLVGIMRSASDRSFFPIPREPHKGAPTHTVNVFCSDKCHNLVDWAASATHPPNHMYCFHPSCCPCLSVDSHTNQSMPPRPAVKNTTTRRCTAQTSMPAPPHESRSRNPRTIHHAMPATPFFTSSFCLLIITTGT